MKRTLIPVFLLALGCTEPTNPVDPPADEPEPVAPAEHPGLKNPSEARYEAPAKFRVRFETTKGDFVVEVVRDWAPNGADRLYSLVKVGFFEDIAVFRVVEGFVAQFGIHGDPEVSAAWKSHRILDDKTIESNARGTLTFACAGPNSRTTQLFVNYGNNARLDNYQQGFPPVGKVVEGMEVVDSFYGAYGGAPSAAQPQIQARGNAFLRKNYPNLDYIKRATLVE